MPRIEGGFMRPSRIPPLLLLVLLSVTLPPETTLASRGSATRSVVWAKHGMVCAAQPLAVQAGVEILKQGGTAVDAAIAVNACLGLMAPNATGPGGALFHLGW